MIAPPKTRNAHLLSAWGAGVALLFLSIGLHGAVQPLIPVAAEFTPRPVSSEEVIIEEFDPPPAPAAARAAEPVAQDPAIEEIEIPAVPEIAEPITPPEMVDITPLEPIPEPQKPRPLPAAQSPVRKPAAQARPPAQTPRPATPGTSSGSGRGRFPAPYYPASARKAGLQGSVQLQVTVEANGVPSSVVVTKSSGHAVLDTAARDGVLRRWRWPTGTVRSILVPIRYNLE